MTQATAQIRRNAIHHNRSAFADFPAHYRIVGACRRAACGMTDTFALARINVLVVADCYRAAMTWTRQQISARLPSFVEKLLLGQPVKRQTFIDEIEAGLAKRGRYDSDAKDQKPLSTFLAGACRISLKPEGNAFTAKAWLNDEIHVTARRDNAAVTNTAGPLTSGAYLSTLPDRRICDVVAATLLAGFDEPILSADNECRHNRSELVLRYKVRLP